MNSKICLSLVCALSIGAYAVDLGTVDVTEVIQSKVVENVNEVDVKNADLAEALAKQTPSIDLVRRSGIANDILLRGQKRDNIVVTVDDAKIYGACPNRMDPPTSHIVVSNIDKVIVSEGPYNVEDFGVLSGDVKVETKKPEKKFGGNVYVNMGSFNYKKAGATVSGGNDKIRVLLTGSYEQGDQYKDGDGNDFAQQITNATAGTPLAGAQMQPQYADMKAFEKTTFMGKIFANVTDNQDLELSYTLNRSNDVLYPNSKMDAIYDDSDIVNFKYTLLGLGKYSKKLQIKAYYSQVEHPMSTKYRLFSGVDSANEKISKLNTEMMGAKIINDMDLNDGLFTVGLDTSKRWWDGTYTGYGTAAGITGRPSIQDVDTINSALFVKYNKDIDKLNIQVGARVDHTTISTGDTAFDDRNFDALSANVLASYKLGGGLKVFAGVGRSSRVPDGRELYFKSSTGALIGTPTLDQTTNTEIDVGVEKYYDSGKIKAKAFYSMLGDYIYFHKDAPTNAFENIDATIYGVEVSGTFDLLDNLYVDYGMAYQRGTKDKPLAGQTDKDLADIPPLKTNVAVNYDYDDTTSIRAEVIAAASWSKYDGDNGEQELPGYTVLNLKAQKTFMKHLDVTVGVDNIFDKTYAVSNTYADLTLLTDGTSGEVMLLNEPGRYFYVNLKYNF